MATKPTRRLDAFFEELCVMYGWCLSAAERWGVEHGATDELQKFVARVIETYTRQPADLCDRRQRQ